MIWSGLEYGRRPEDWCAYRIICDRYELIYAEDFWGLVNSPSPYTTPGSWPDAEPLDEDYDDEQGRYYRPVEAHSYRNKGII